MMNSIALSNSIPISWVTRIRNCLLAPVQALIIPPVFGLAVKAQANNTVNPTAYGFEAGAGFAPEALSIVITSLVMFMIFGWAAWAFLGVTLESIRNGAYGIWLMMIAALIVIVSLVSTVVLS